MHPIIIIGTGLAGYQLAREFRKLDPASPLMLVTTNDGRFYSKPLLSTALTQGKNYETLTTATADAMSTQLNATILTKKHVSSIDSEHKTIRIDNENFPYSKLILACGADVITISIAGNAAADVVSVNHIDDYAEFQNKIASKKHITILGTGLIGCEFANDLANAGYKVEMIALARSPLDILLPETIGRLLQKAFEKNGITFHFECTLKEVNKLGAGYRVALSNGEFFETEIVLSAIGLKPHLALAKSALIETARGVTVNRYLETTIQDIYALGDCAEVEGHVLPYIAPIFNGAKALAKTLAGERTAVHYPAMPIIVKTPMFPLVICPPPKNSVGEWEIQQDNETVRAFFYTAERKLQGFVLTHEAVKERMTLVKQVPELF